ncbi:LysR family transcriptional regulator [Nocardioides pantholopis]|uniref:LysR family transcriptional regulator n=1 Tax=Nocardioides pantholopis TaxID=2483798 RepID=UPI000F07FF08|nr:LysR family transcriptional regulator [Nocardioides pantholopis]
MEVHQLRAFLTVRDTGSATAAAARLGVRQSTVSAAIRSLEHDLGAQLFHRVGRGMTPTPAGRALVGSARRILRDCDQAAELLSSTGQRGRLELAALSTVVSGPLSDQVARWLDSAPGRTVQVHDLAREESAVEVLLNGTAEVVCTRLPLAVPTDERLEQIEIGAWGWQVAFPPGTEPPTQESAQESVSMGELAGVPMLLVAPGRHSALERATTRTPLTVAVVADQREARTSLMLAGVGATIVGPRLAAEARDAGAPVRDLSPSYDQRVGLVYDAEALSPLARSFVDAALADHGQERTARG